MGNVSIEIDLGKGEPDGVKYSIRLWGYYPDNNTEGKKKGESIGGVSRETCPTTLPSAINQARDMWRLWAKEFPGSMIQVWIHEKSYPPKIGTVGAVFKADNFALFKPGSKADQGTPF